MHSQVSRGTEKTAFMQLGQKQVSTLSRFLFKHQNESSVFPFSAVFLVSLWYALNRTSFYLAMRNQLKK